MSLSQMQVFNEYIMPATIETLDSMIEKFNANSGGAIVMTSAGFTGDFMQLSFFASVHSAQRRVDRYAANAAASVTDLTEVKESSVKVAGGFGPIRYEPAQMTWLQRPTVQAVEAASRNFAEALMKDQLHTAIAAADAAMANNAPVFEDQSLVGPVTYERINLSHARFGDMSGTLITDVMSGATMHALIGANISNANRLFEANGVLLIDILGKIVVVTDAPALSVGGNRVLSLTAGGITVSDGGDIISNVETSNGNERIETTFQADYSFGLSVKGYTWDEANGGKSPTDAELSTGTNWDQVATSHKHTAGTVLLAQ